MLGGPTASGGVSWSCSNQVSRTNTLLFNNRHENPNARLLIYRGDLTLNGKGSSITYSFIGNSGYGDDFTIAISYVN